MWPHLYYRDNLADYPFDGALDDSDGDDDEDQAVGNLVRGVTRGVGATKAVVPSFVFLILLDSGMDAMLIRHATSCSGRMTCGVDKSIGIRGISV